MTGPEPEVNTSRTGRCPALSDLSDPQGVEIRKWSGLQGKIVGTVIRLWGTPAITGLYLPDVMPRHFLNWLPLQQPRWEVTNSGAPGLLQSMERTPPSPSAFFLQASTKVLPFHICILQRTMTRTPKLSNFGSGTTKS